MAKVLFIDINEQLPEYSSSNLGWWVLDGSNRLYLGTTDGWKELTGDAITTLIGDLFNLTTDNKESVISAINELEDRVAALESNGFSFGDSDGSELGELLSLIVEMRDKVGDLDTLNTVNKDDLVSAINELMETTNSLKVDIDDDDYPKLFWTSLDGSTLPTSKADGNYPGRIIWHSKKQSFEGYATLKVQGNSSTAYAKKNFTITFYSDAECSSKLKVDFKNWGKQCKFVMKANWIDLTHARNVVSCRIWSQMMSTRETYDQYPEQLTSSPNNGVVDGFPIVFFANGVYQGRYSFNIPKDPWMNNMSKTNDDEVILCGENYVSGCFRALPVINETDWTDELHDTVPQTIKDSWAAAISFVMNSTDAEFKANLGNYFDIPSLIDYYIFGVVSCNLDGFGKNQMYIKYADTPYIVQTYDLDSTWGLWWNGNSFVAADYAREQYQDLQDCPLEEKGNKLFLRLASLFSDEIYERWLEVKDGVLSVDNLILNFERWCDIVPKYIVEEDYASTTANGSYTGIPQKSTNNIQQIRKYIVDRRAYCESAFSITKYFTLSASSLRGHAEDVINIILSTNLESNAATFACSGAGTFSQANMQVTINANAQSGDTIVLTAVSDVDSDYSDSITITVTAAGVVYTLNKEFTSDISEAVNSNVVLFDETMPTWTMYIAAQSLAAGGGQAVAVNVGDDTYNTGNSLHVKQTNHANEVTVNINGLDMGAVTQSGRFDIAFKRDNSTFYYSLDGQTWTATMGNFVLPNTVKPLTIGTAQNAQGSFVAKNSGQQNLLWDGNVIVTIYDDALDDVSDLWDTPFINNTRYITLSPVTTHPIPGATQQVLVSGTNYRDQRWDWTVSGHAIVDTNGLVTVNSDAEEGDTITVTCTAVNTSEQAVPASASVTFTVGSSSNEVVLWSAKTGDGTSFTRTLTIGAGNDVNFLAGDYIEAKMDFTNETIVSQVATLLQIGPDITTYNNALQLERQANNNWVNIRTWANTTAGNSSIQQGIQFANKVFWIRLTNDGFYYSTDGVNYTVCNWGANTTYGDAWVADRVSSSSIQIGLYQCTGGTNLANGTYYEYIKIVKSASSGDLPYYELTADETVINPGETVEIVVDTNLPNDGSTFIVTGPATFDSTTKILTVNSNASAHASITVTGTSTVSSTYTHTLTLEVGAIYTISAPTLTVAPGSVIPITVTTNLSSSAATLPPSITGDATYDASTMKLTISSSAADGSTITFKLASIEDDGVYDDYLDDTLVFTVDASAAVYYYELATAHTGSTVHPDDVITVSINTNLASDASTFQISGDATFNSTTMQITVNSSCTNNSTITLTATSSEDSNYSHSLTFTVVTEVVTYYDRFGEASPSPVSWTLQDAAVSPKGFMFRVDDKLDFSKGDYIEIQISQVVGGCPFIFGHRGCFSGGNPGSPNGTGCYSFYDWPSNGWTQIREQDGQYTGNRIFLNQPANTAKPLTIKISADKVEYMSNGSTTYVNANSQYIEDIITLNPDLYIGSERNSTEATYNWIRIVNKL